MKPLRLGVLPLLVFYGSFLACLGSFNVSVLFDQAEGLKSGDRVLWNRQTIGTVHAVKTNAAGRKAILIRIKRGSHELITDQSRFLLRSDPERPDHRSLEMILLAEGGTPLPDGAEVEGSNPLSLTLESGERELRSWSEIIKKELERWKKDLSDLPVQEWHKQLQRQMEYWARELEQAGEETRRYFRKEILPRLEEAVRELRKRLLQQGRQKDAEILDVKLKALKKA